MKFTCSLLILSLALLAGCKRPARDHVDPMASPARSSTYDADFTPMQNSHLATAKFTPQQTPDEEGEITTPDTTTEEPETPAEPTTEPEPDTSGGLVLPNE